MLVLNDSVDSLPKAADFRFHASDAIICTMSTLQPAQMLIICPLVFLGGFVDAIAGGGGLITLPAYMIAGLPVHRAIATNKLSSSMGSVTATARYARSGYIPYRQAPFFSGCARAGSASGARLASRIV